MKKGIVFLLLLTCFSFATRASHITGGEMYYSFRGIFGGQYQYNVTLKLYMRCNSGRQFPDPAIISVFDKTTRARVDDIDVPLTQQVTISLTDTDPCITNPPSVCYEVAYYNFIVSLPASAEGYILASQVNFRISGINNVSGSVQVGATYIAEIPGLGITGNGPDNNSANFTGSDLVIVCSGNFFQYSFAAKDADNDELSYSFCSAYNSNGGGGNGSNNNGPTSPPPFYPVPYDVNFSESAPLGSGVQINPSTGLISGIAPASGIYVVTVCVEESRNGRVIATQRKDIQINVADCSIAAARLLPEYMLCDTTQTISLVNLSNSPLIITHDWEIHKMTNGISGPLIFTSTNPTAIYTFPDTGMYLIRLIINKGQTCTDTTTSLARVYPGFKPGFDVTGFCNTHPSSFSDFTTSFYGTVNTWMWDFGELSTINDISSIKNPVYSYPILGTKNPELIVSDTKGCRGTVTKSINIFDKPPLLLAFRDTLICKNDVVQLQSSATGIFIWSPNINITGAGTAAPIVSPLVTTTYFANLDYDGCQNRDSVKVRVVDHVTLQAMDDTTICQGDAIQLTTMSDALYYTWTPAAQLSAATIQSPIAMTNTTTAYQVTGVIGGCSATRQIIVTTVPYPFVFAGNDTTICYNTPAQLHSITDDNTGTWSPSASLTNANILNPIAYPVRTTAYILTVPGAKGCPKPRMDTVLVTVYPKMHAFAGNDTSVIVGQPLQLDASGGVDYLWVPSTNLSSSIVKNPVAIFEAPSNGIQYKVLMHSSIGCADSAYITVKTFQSGPTVFVPSAFTPNSDGRNDILRPIAVGMKNIENFSIYNRWGQLIFNTSINGQGWDGKVNGRPQATNTFVWMVKAIDFKGNPYFQKGFVTLIK